MTKYFIGIIGALVGALAGVWLILAPFALGYQPEGAEWIDATRIDYWTGIAVLSISGVGLTSYILALRAELKSRGIIKTEPAYRTPTAAAPGGESQGYVSQADLEQVLLPLATALLKDIQEQQHKRESADRTRESNAIPDGQRGAERRAQQ